jgi:hypothetical protein
MDSNSNNPNEKIFESYKKIIELQNGQIDNLKKKIELMNNAQTDDSVVLILKSQIDILKKKIELMNNAQTDDSVIQLLKSQLDNREHYIELLVKHNELLKSSVNLLRKHIGDEEYIIGDFILDELANNEYIVFLLNKFKSYNFDRMKNYSDSNDYEFEFSTYKEFIQFNENEFAELPKKQRNFLSQLTSKIENGEISIGSNVYFNIWKANTFYINQNKKICINHPR